MRSTKKNAGARALFVSLAVRRNYAACLCIAPLADALPRIAFTERSIAAHSRLISAAAGLRQIFPRAFAMTERHQEIGAIGDLAAPYRRPEFGQRFTRDGDDRALTSSLRAGAPLTRPHRACARRGRTEWFPARR